MKTSRLKNIVIVILLLVNAFLLFLLLSRRAEERDSNERRVEQLCTLFEKNGVAFDRALLPDEETHLSLSLERDASREEAFASALLGTAESSDSGGGVSRFTGEYGSCSIRSGGTVDVLLSRPVDDPESFSKQLFKTFGYTFLTSQLTDGSGSVTGMRSEKGQLIFNASLTLTFSDSSLTGVSGTFLPALDEGRRTDGLDAGRRACAFSGLLQRFGRRMYRGPRAGRRLSSPDVVCLAAAAARRVAHLHGCQQLLCELQDRRDHTRMKFFLQHF